MVTLKQIEEFISSQPIAMVGVSRNPRKFGYAAFKELREKGMNIIPVNRYASEILGEKVYPDVASLPPEVKGLIVMTKKTDSPAVVKDTIKKGIKQLWVQQMSDNKEVLEELKDSGINYITGQCILMYYNPTGIHKFHGKLKKFFGRYPK
jgi:predicted CoA-binding protein